MRTITFTVQIQADFPKRSRCPKAVALKLCDDLNTILTQYDSMTGGAQIIPVLRNVKVATTPDD